MAASGPARGTRGAGEAHRGRAAAEQSFALPPEELARDRFVIGGPETVAGRLIEYQEALRMNVLGLRMPRVGMPHALVTGSLERFCDKVLPALHARTGR